MVGAHQHERFPPPVAPKNYACYEGDEEEKEVLKHIVSPSAVVDDLIPILFEAETPLRVSEKSHE